MMHLKMSFSAALNMAVFTQLPVDTNNFELCLGVGSKGGQGVAVDVAQVADLSATNIASEFLSDLNSASPFVVKSGVVENGAEIRKLIADCLSDEKRPDGAIVVPVMYRTVDGKPVACFPSFPVEATGEQCLAISPDGFFVTNPDTFAAVEQHCDQQFKNFVASNFLYGVHEVATMPKMNLQRNAMYILLDVE